MIDGIRLKVCGLTSLVDAELADRCGADYFGFILHPKSPRFLPLPQFQAMAARLPERRKVAVMVAPSDPELAAAADAGFDYFQVHFPRATPAATLAEWSRRVGRDRLWLAPQLPPPDDPTPETLTAAKFLLLDTYHKDQYGGTGQPGDWPKFARLQAAHPEHRWILSGGLKPENIGEALRASGAKFVDVNSGEESAPGVKDLAKLKAFVVALHRAQAGR